MGIFLSRAMTSYPWSFIQELGWHYSVPCQVIPQTSWKRYLDVHHRQEVVFLAHTSTTYTYMYRYMRMDLWCEKTLQHIYIELFNIEYVCACDWEKSISMSGLASCFPHKKWQRLWRPTTAFRHANASPVVAPDVPADVVAALQGAT